MKARFSTILIGLMAASVLTLCVWVSGQGRLLFPHAVMVETDLRSFPLARTLSIIHGSTKERPQVLRVLFYGQSITSPRWTDLAADHLQRTYPNTNFVFRNMAIGGFSAKQLERTVERDVTDFYPDLIVFHVYGDHHAYERIMQIIRSRTAAEVILQTDHVVIPVEPVCHEGLHLSLVAPPGCKGILFFKQRSWEEFMSGIFIPDLASRYGLAVEPQRAMWNAYLLEHKIEPEALLADPPHPNQAGWQLMAQIFESYFDATVANYHGERSRLVTTLPPPSVGQEQHYEFDGNRVEIIGNGPLDGHILAQIDELAPTSIDGCWQTSRTTRLEDWPAVRKVTVKSDFKLSETWTATVRNFNDDQSDFEFTVVGDKTGPDGQGHGNSDFVSPSGRIRIAAEDWQIHDRFVQFKKKVPEDFRITWSRYFACQDLPAIPLDEGSTEIDHVIATGLPNGHHRLTLRIEPGAASVREIRVFRPPLH